MQRRVLPPRARVPWILSGGNKPLEVGTSATGDPLSILSPSYLEIMQ